MTASEIIGLTVAFILAFGGIGLMLYGLVARPLLMRWRTRVFTTPEVTDADETIARDTVSEVAQDAGIDAPKVRVVPWLGRPLPGWSGLFGGGGLALTKFTPGRPTQIVLATGATRVLSPAALRHLVAHEMGHVVLHADRKGRIRHLLWLLALLLFLTAVVLTFRHLGVAPLLPLIFAAVGFLAFRMAFMRRAEFAADRFAILLTRDIAGAAELNTAYEEHSPERGSWFDTLGGLLSTHPPRAKRLATMKAVLEETPARQGDTDVR